jgi:transcriptional regulator with XRE-family HTH domain
MLQGASTAVGTSFADSKPACFEHEEREVLACRHCRLVQFRTRASLCRRCHKPLDGEVWNRTELDAAGVRSEPGASEVSDAVKNLGVRVREIRKERGLTQRVLACRMNVPRTYISKVEMGRVVPSLSTLWRIAGDLEVSVTYLLCDESKRRRDDEIARILAVFGLIRCGSNFCGDSRGGTEKIGNTISSSRRSRIRRRRLCRKAYLCRV